jgi:signal transduction histidine kinase
LHQVRFEASELLDAVADEALLHSPDVRIGMRTDPADLSLYGDPERLHQVMANLVENASRFAPDVSTVMLSARREPCGGGEGSLGPARVVLEVVDEGPGIPEEALGRVFERFYRTDEARSTDEGGSGLGLAIARWIVELHGGRIHAERIEPTGCRMVVELPATASSS